jgi:hypothetical protein
VDDGIVKFEHDFLISYAHIDDQALVVGEKGWVSTLHRLLEIRVGQLRGQTPKIWRDPKLQGNDYFADTILERLPKVAALVSVLSPRYVQSEWCNRELKEFWRAAELSGGVRVADKARIFKVVKTPVDQQRLPEEVQPMLGYEFFTYDPDSGRPRELTQVSDATANRPFLTKLDDLAYDIAQLLELLEKEAGTAPSVPRKGTVFLAETSFELREQREAIKRDLIRNGYEVLPDRPLPLVGPELDAMCNEQLARCKLSIHLIGKNYGVIPEGAMQSLPERQQALASERGAAGGVSSVIWIAPDVEPDDERQRKFIEHLRTDSAVHATAEVLEIPIEDVKTLIYRKLTPPPSLPRIKTAYGNIRIDLKRVYLLCDQQDVDAVGPLTDHLFAAGYEVLQPIFDEDEAQTRIEHEESLRSADGVLLYYGAGSEMWLRRKLREMQKSAGLGRDKPWLARAIYVAQPATPQKERFRTLEATILHEPSGGFDAEILDPFVRAMNKPEGARP